MFRFRSNFVSSLKNDCSFNSSILNFKSALFKTNFGLKNFVSSSHRHFTTSFDKKRNVAVIAHVDHGKTTLVDKLLIDAGALAASSDGGRVMDNNDLEKERGITISSKHTSAEWKDVAINIVDTPGHADFGGEVERVLSMVDGCLLVVDATEGAMPQTKFVVQKALKANLKPILILNKMDRETARPDEVQNEIFDLLFNSGANDEQLDYPTIFASATNGWSQVVGEDEKRVENMQPILDTILKHIPPPKGDAKAPFALSVTSIAHHDIFGRIATGRINQGTINLGDTIKSIGFDMENENQVIEKGSGTVVKLLARRGTDTYFPATADVGDIVGIAGLDKAANVTDTLTSENGVDKPLECVMIDPPVLSMRFRLNDSPLGGREGTQVTTQALEKRLFQELENNPSLQVVKVGESFEVKGRGELQLAILIENMRREGFELSVAPPQVIFRTENGQKLEPVEELVIDCDSADVGKLIDVLSKRRGEVQEVKDGETKTKITFLVPARGLIGFQREFQMMTRGTGIMAHLHHGYEPMRGPLETSRKGALISMATGKATSYALLSLEARGQMFISPGDELYEGMIVGENSRDQDLDINPVRSKKLTNVRSSGHEDTVRLTPPVELTLESAMSWIREGEMMEVTPSRIRLRMQYLDPNERKRHTRKSK
mmetsp:Transcript_9502/g.16111  ORF Transcript_9502/g.16111 Transcript_9502/m.16111 type:complete len:661 (-) Transcript_9502:27-2009(-)